MFSAKPVYCHTVSMTFDRARYRYISFEQLKNHALMGLINEQFCVRYRPLKKAVNTRLTENFVSHLLLVCLLLKFMPVMPFFILDFISLRVILIIIIP